MIANISLEDKYKLEHGRVYITGVQALALSLIHISEPTRPY